MSEIECKHQRQYCRYWLSNTMNNTNGSPIDEYRKMLDNYYNNKLLDHYIPNKLKIEDFHKALFAETNQYYKQKSGFWLHQQSEKCAQDEDGRLVSYIDKYSNDGLMIATRDELLKHHQDVLLEKSTCIDLIKNKKK
eukprot:523726_1